MVVNGVPGEATGTFEYNRKEAEYLNRGRDTSLSLTIAAPRRDLRRHKGQGTLVRANREKALLSHVYTKAMERGMVDYNPCRGVLRNAEMAPERMIEDMNIRGYLRRPSRPSNA